MSVPGGKVEDSDNESDDYDDDDIDVEDYIMDCFLEIILCVIPIQKAGFYWFNRHISMSSFGFLPFLSRNIENCSSYGI